MDSSDFELALLGRLMLGSVFIVSAGLKLKGMAAFLEAVAGYRLLSRWAIAPVGVTIAGLELLLGFSLLVGFYVGVSAAMISILLAIFTGAVSLKMAKGEPVRNCGCFGQLLPESSHWALFARNATFLGLCMYLVLSSRFSTMFDPLPIDSSLLPTILMAIAAVLILYLSSYIFQLLEPFSLLHGRQRISSTGRRS